MIKALAIDRKNISAHIFLFSVLFILEKNIEKHIRDANSSHTKWKSKLWGLNNDKNAENEDGNIVQDSK